VSGFGSGSGGSPGWGPDRGGFGAGRPRDPHVRAGGSEEGRPDSDPVIKDHRRIDPQTGQVREPHGGASGPTGGASPFPGTGGPGARDPREPANASQPISVDLTAAELDLARQEAAERTADLQRVTAEYANYRKRVDRDREVATATAKASVISEMLPVLDDLDRARAHGDLVGSFGAVADKFVALLTKLGLTPVGTVGEPFDPAVHEAVQFSTSAEVTEPTVTGVFRAGYRYGDRLIRPAVVVVTGPETESGGAAGDPATGGESVGDAAGDPAAQSERGDDAARKSAGGDTSGKVF
jgi:molecular chaperone GrpE